MYLLRALIGCLDCLQLLRLVRVITLVLVYGTQMKTTLKVGTHEASSRKDRSLRYATSCALLRRHVTKSRRSPTKGFHARNFIISFHIQDDGPDGVLPLVYFYFFEGTGRDINENLSLLCSDDLTHEIKTSLSLCGLLWEQTSVAPKTNSLLNGHVTKRKLLQQSRVMTCLLAFPALKRLC